MLVHCTPIRRQQFAPPAYSDGLRAATKSLFWLIEPQAPYAPPGWYQVTVHIMVSVVSLGVEFEGLTLVRVHATSKNSRHDDDSGDLRIQHSDGIVGMAYQSRWVPEWQVSVTFRPIDIGPFMSVQSSYGPYGKSRVGSGAAHLVDRCTCVVE